MKRPSNALRHFRFVFVLFLIGHSVAFEKASWFLLYDFCCWGFEMYFSFDLCFFFFLEFLIGLSLVCNGD